MFLYQKVSLLRHSHAHFCLNSNRKIWKGLKRHIQYLFDIVLTDWKKKICKMDPNRVKKKEFRKCAKWWRNFELIYWKIYDICVERSRQFYLRAALHSSFWMNRDTFGPLKRKLFTAGIEKSLTWRQPPTTHKSNYYVQRNTFVNENKIATFRGALNPSNKSFFKDLQSPFNIGDVACDISVTLTQCNSPNIDMNQGGGLRYYGGGL